MAKQVFTTNTEWAPGLEAKNDAGYYAMSYVSNGGAGLGGGTLRVWTDIDGVKVPVPNSKLTAAKLDDNGDAIQTIIFSAAGAISVALTGATTPNITVALR